jgi:thiamine-monophosphate kinase
VLPAAGSTLVTTDILIENTHFRTDINHYRDIGWKSVAVNLSDIAAMGGTPTYTFLSIGLPDMEIDDACELFTGIAECVEAGGSVIAGGDTVFSSSGITISVTQLGLVGSGRPLKRSGAQVGDSIIVTGTLGDSIAGLKLLLRDGLVKTEAEFPCLVHRHIHPEARLNASKASFNTGHVNSMMDLSDGLFKDLHRLCEASKVGAVIESVKLPVSEQLHTAASDLGTTAANLAASGGEDYELLLTCSTEHAGSILEAIRDVPCEATVIGRITQSQEVILLDENSNPIVWPTAWEHF